MTHAIGLNAIYYQIKTAQQISSRAGSTGNFSIWNQVFTQLKVGYQIHGGRVSSVMGLGTLVYKLTGRLEGAQA